MPKELDWERKTQIELPCPQNIHHLWGGHDVRAVQRVGRQELKARKRQGVSEILEVGG